MKILLTILFSLILNFTNAQFVTLSVDTVIYGIWDLQGKTLNINGKISGNVIIKNAIIEANRYAQIFDTNVALENCKTDNFSVAWYGAKPTNTDNSEAFQKSSDMCIKNNIYNLFIPEGAYTISNSWLLRNLYNGRYIPWSLHIKGQGNIWSNKTLLKYSGNSFAVGMQLAKGVIFEGIAITGVYSAPLNLGQEYYFSDFPVVPGYSGLVIDYDGTNLTSGSTGVRIKDTWIEKFDVCYDISPNGVTYNADIIKLEDIKVGNCRVGVRSGQAQEKGNEINNIVAWGNTQILIQIGKSGKWQAGHYIVRGGNIAGNVIQLFDVQLSGWNSFTVYGLYAEGIARLGYFSAQTSQHKIPIELDGLNIRFAPQSLAGKQNLIYSWAQRLMISNSNLWYYGVVGDTMTFAGYCTFNNVDFGLSKWQNNYINHLDYSNGNFIIKRTQ